MPSSSLAPTSTTYLGVILGCAISIPIGTAAITLAVVLLLLRRRRHHKQAHNTPIMDKKNGVPGNSPAPGAEANTLGLHTSEIDGEPVQSPGGSRGKLKS